MLYNVNFPLLNDGQCSIFQWFFHSWTGLLKKNSHVYPLQALNICFEVNFATEKIKICISNSDGPLTLEKFKFKIYLLN